MKVSIPNITELWSTAWGKVALASAGLLAIGAGHYAGFMRSVPAEIRDVAGEQFALSLTATFLLYLAASLAIVRTAIFLIQPIIWISVASVLRAASSKFQFTKRVLRIERCFAGGSRLFSMLLGGSIFLTEYAGLKGSWVLGVGAALFTLGMLFGGRSVLLLNRSKAEISRRRAAALSAQFIGSLISATIVAPFCSDGFDFLISSNSRTSHSAAVASHSMEER